MMMTNIRVYRAIAEEAAAESKRLSDKATTPRGDGGFVVRWDPEQRSFRQSLIAIVFAGMYLEALFGLVGSERFGVREWYSEHDRKKYEDKLKLLGVEDPKLLADCKRFRESRKDVVHEKPFDMAAEMRTGQTEAAFALDLIGSVTNALER